MANIHIRDPKTDFIYEIRNNEIYSDSNVFIRDFDKNTSLVEILSEIDTYSNIVLKKLGFKSQAKRD